MKFEHESAQGEYGSNLGEAVGGAGDDEVVEEARCGQVRPRELRWCSWLDTRKLTWRLPARLAAQQLPFALSLRLAEQQLQSTASELTGAKTVMAV